MNPYSWYQARAFEPAAEKYPNTIPEQTQIRKLQDKMIRIMKYFLEKYCLSAGLKADKD